MPIAQVLALLATYGPPIIPVIQQIVTWIEGGKATVTSADLALLAKMGQTKSYDFLAQAGIQIVNGQVVPIAPVAAAPAVK